MRTAFTSVKTVALTPIPSDNASTTTAENHFSLTISLQANWKSLMRLMRLPCTKMCPLKFGGVHHYYVAGALRLTVDADQFDSSHQMPRPRPVPRSSVRLTTFG